MNKDSQIKFSIIFITFTGDGGSGVYTLDSNINKFVLTSIPSYIAGCARAGLPA